VQAFDDPYIGTRFNANTNHYYLHCSSARLSAALLLDIRAFQPSACAI
jgi:hypothetical protein